MRMVQQAALAGILGAAVLLAGCSTYPMKEAGSSLPDADTPGAQLFVQRCGICHEVPHPARHDYPGWRYLVALMEQRMAERGVAPLTASDRDAILAYLRSNAR